MRRQSSNIADQIKNDFSVLLLPPLLSGVALKVENPLTADADVDGFASIPISSEAHFYLIEYVLVEFKRLFISWHRLRSSPQQLSL